MLSFIWETVSNHPLLVIFGVIILVSKLFLTPGGGPMPEHPGHKVRSIENLSDWEETLSEAKEKNLLVIADFYATWCGPCRYASPTFGKLSTGTPPLSSPYCQNVAFHMTFPSHGVPIENLDVLFVKIDVDKAADVSMANNIKAMPTFLFFKDKKKVDQLTGWNETRLKTLMQKYR
eukprot:scaffold954_cov173-Ochromonas_danica.AAC.5